MMYAFIIDFVSKPIFYGWYCIHWTENFWYIENKLNCGILSGVELWHLFYYTSKDKSLVVRQKVYYSGNI